ncbi:hypothetical protein GQX74_007262 [Glossina fuscipes]|nr:hypothetical protein GQX74_007262 [Glossina fuscipes]
MPGRRLTRSCKQDGERTKKKERKTSLTLVHFMETRARLRNTNRSSCSNANNAESSENEVKRKGGANFSSKKSKYAKTNVSIILKANRIGFLAETRSREGFGKVFRNLKVTNFLIFVIYSALVSEEHSPAQHIPQMLIRCR